MTEKTGLRFDQSHKVSLSDDQQTLTVESPDGTVHSFKAHDPDKNTCRGCAFKTTSDEHEFSGSHQSCGIGWTVKWVKSCQKHARQNGRPIVWVRQSVEQTKTSKRIEHYNRIDAALRRNLSDSEYRACSVSLEALFWGDTT